MHGQVFFPQRCLFSPRNINKYNQTVSQISSSSAFVFRHKQSDAVYRNKWVFSRGICGCLIISVLHGVHIMAWIQFCGSSVFVVVVLVLSLFCGNNVLLSKQPQLFITWKAMINSLTLDDPVLTSHVYSSKANKPFVVLLLLLCHFV